MIDRERLLGIHLEDTELPKIPKETFELGFLKYFAEHKEVEDGNITATWLAISKGPHRPVEVVDNDGSVLYVVPPLIANNVDASVGNSSKLQETPTPTLDEVSEKAAATDLNVPGKGKPMLVKALQETQGIISENIAPFDTFIATKYNEVYGNEKDSGHMGENLDDDDDELMLD